MKSLSVVHCVCSSWVCGRSVSFFGTGRKNTLWINKLDENKVLLSFGFLCTV